MKPALTTRQRQIYEFLRDKIVNRGYGPTIREIGKHFGIRSPNGVMCHLSALEKKGLILREPNEARAIRLVEKPRDDLLVAIEAVLRVCEPTSEASRAALALLKQERNIYWGSEQ